MFTLLTLPVVLLLDRLLGEPLRWHPLVGFGRYAKWLEQRLNRASAGFPRGFLAWFLAVAPITALVAVADYWLGGWWLSILFGWLAIGWHSLRQHALWVKQALDDDNLPVARHKVGWLVSRDTSQLDERGVSRACIESVLENGSDAIIAPLFWLLLAGAPGVVFYRLCNTLDAMWGYRTERFEYFGKWTAWMDDVLNYFPARLCSLLYTLTGNTRSALRAWREQAKVWYSPNAGVVMASGAGALQVTLGGNASYHGHEKPRPRLGSGITPMSIDIDRSIDLLDQSVLLFTLLVSIATGTWYVFYA